jgi:hypothetical protein
MDLFVFLLAVGLKAKEGSPIRLRMIEYFTTTQESADYAIQNVKKAYITRYHLGDKDDIDLQETLGVYEIIRVCQSLDYDEAFTMLRTKLNGLFDEYLKTSDMLIGAISKDFRVGRIDKAETQFRKRMAVGKGRRPRNQEER